MATIQRTDCGQSATDVLIKAMERAGEMRTVVVIYDTTEEYEKETGTTGGVLVQDNTVVSQINWLIDCAKRWLFED